MFVPSAALLTPSANYERDLSNLADAKGTSSAGSLGTVVYYISEAVSSERQRYSVFFGVRAAFI